MANIKEINGVPLTGISQISGVTVTGTGLKNVAGTILNFSAAANVTGPPFLITPPALSTYYSCANPFNPPVKVIDMVWGGTPAPIITYDWINDNGEEARSIGQYTEALVLQYDMYDMYFYCIITATNSAGAARTKTGTLYSADCSQTTTTTAAAANTTTTTTASLAIQVTLYGSGLLHNDGYGAEDIDAVCLGGAKSGVLGMPAPLYLNSTLSEIFEDVNLTVFFTGLRADRYYYVQASGTIADSSILHNIADGRVELTPCQ